MSVKTLFAGGKYKQLIDQWKGVLSLIVLYHVSSVQDNINSGSRLVHVWYQATTWTIVDL